MIDPKLLSNFDDKQIADLKARIGAANPRTLHVLDSLDQPTKLAYLLADSESQRMQVTREFWSAKFKEGVSFLGFGACIPMVVLAGMALYPGVPVEPQEAVLLQSMSSAIGVSAVALNAAKGWASDKVATLIEKSAAKFSPQAIMPMLPASNVTEAQVNNFASLAGRIRKASPAEREIFGIVGRLVSANVSANLNGTGIDYAKQEKHLTDIRAKLDALSVADPLGARECEGRLVVSLKGYGLSLPPSQKQESSLRRDSGGLALGA
jgi:hypothetical protein